jgi:hypothetical protein
MSVLVVVESYFGNTRHIADVVAERLRADGIHTTVVTVEDAPTLLDDGIQLLVVGAPTHNLGLSTGESRRTASAQVGQPEPRIGVREWAERLAQPSVPPLVALFDTRTGHPWMAGSAAAQASVLFARKGFPVLAARETFWVHGITGPLTAGEDERARRWTNAVAARLEGRRLSQRGYGPAGSPLKPGP